MIPAPPGIAAHYEIKRADGKTRFASRTVIAFNDHGEPLVVGGQELVTASAHGKYELMDHGADQYTALIPGGGWRVKWDGGADTPLLGWAVSPDGYVVALHPDEDGHVEDSHEWAAGTYRIHHPDAKDAE